MEIELPSMDSVSYTHLGTVTAGGRPVLSHIEFEIRGTEKIAVVGKNGAGKTTLLLSLIHI